MSPDSVLAEISAIKQQLVIGDTRMTSIEESLIETKETHKGNTQTLEEIKELLELGKTSMKLLRYLGIFIKWASTLIAGTLVIWAVFTGRSPKG